MPYIKQAYRQEYDLLVKSIVLHDYHNAGELNFLITKMLNEFIAQNGLSYSTLNELVGMLECAKLELYRRVAAPYEDQKKFDNGDVYEVTL
jgi:hypothetical protein